MMIAGKRNKMKKEYFIVFGIVILIGLLVVVFGKYFKRINWQKVFADPHCEKIGEAALYRKKLMGKFMSHEFVRCEEIR